jgi:fatty acid omega-hydroxylase
MVKTAVKADTLPDGTPVPAGAMIIYAPYFTARHPAVWGADAEQFRRAAGRAGIGL